MNTNLYRVAAERWPELHDQDQPAGGGPLVQVASLSIKGGKVNFPLSTAWQEFIAKWNTPATLAKISAADFGPSQGIDPESKKLKWNYLLWPSGVTEPNLVNVLEIAGEWALFETIPMTFPIPDIYTPSSTPWLFHKVCDNRGNPVLVKTAPIICPLLGAAFWVPIRALIKS